MDRTVVNNTAESRYELDVEGHLAIAVYDREDDVVAFTHTEVPAALEGRGIGSTLIAGALADVRQQGFKVRPLCSFVRGYFDRHPDQQDLLAARSG